MRRGARNHDGQLSLPGVGALPNKLLRKKGQRGGAHGRLVTAIERWSTTPAGVALVTLNRTPSGRFVLRHGGAAHGARKGTSDLTGFVNGGRVVAVECKVGRDRLRPEQVEYLGSVLLRGGWAFVARSLEGFVADLRAAAAGRYAAPAELSRP